MSTEAQRLRHQTEMRALARDGGAGVLAIDFDDTLTVEGGVPALVELRSRGYGLVVFTSNADLDGIGRWLAGRWPSDAGDPPPPVTDRKPQAVAFIDDKAVRFTGWPDVLEQFRGTPA